MYKIQCLSSNESTARKISQDLGFAIENVLFAPLNYKFEKYKYITLVILSNDEEKKHWLDYFSKQTSDKKNTTLKIFLAVNIISEESRLDDLEFCISLTSNYDSNQIDMISYLLKQKIHYFETLIQKKTTTTQKYLQQLVQKMDWKNQVVLTSDEMSSFLEMQKDIKDILNIGESLTLMKIWEDGNQEDDDFLFLNIEGENFQVRKTDLSENQLRKMVLFVLFYDNYREQKIKQQSLDSIRTLYESIFQMAPFPIAVEVSGRDLIWQNQIFSNLNLLPRTVKQMRANEKIHTKHGFFVVYKHEFIVLENQYNLIYLGQQSEKISSTNEELGIMTSSLAHEMNNPLSAIKAAIEVIGLVSNTIEYKDTLDQMHNTVHRCLQLVKIFLGFTKASHRLSHGQQVLDKIPLRDCWDYALQLMRTRLISASLRLSLDWRVHQSFKVGNSNILTMMLYWILSQVVNIIERKMLVSQNVEHDQKFIIDEYDNAISLKIEIPIKEINDTLQQSLLMTHLLSLEGVKFSLKDQKEILLYH